MEIFLQPAYFPPISSFVLFNKHSIYLEKFANYQKQTYQNRCYICGPNGKQRLTVPVNHTRQIKRTLYKDIKINYTANWQINHWRTLKTAYRNSVYFEFYEDFFQSFYMKKHRFLFDLNIESIHLIGRCLKWKFDFKETSHYELYLEQCKDFRYLIDVKIKMFTDFSTYYQVFSSKYSFISNLSILDLLFNLGSDTIPYLIKQYDTLQV